MVRIAPIVAVFCVLGCRHGTNQYHDAQARVDAQLDADERSDDADDADDMHHDADNGSVPDVDLDVEHDGTRDVSIDSPIDVDDGGDLRPPPPSDLVHYITGDHEDRVVTPRGPGLILMGGSTDVDDAFIWWRELVARGDVVVLRASGSDGYNDYLYSEIGGVDSVETMLVTDGDLAEDRYVAWTVAHAEGIFIAGGDQAVYMRSWKGTALETAIIDAYDRGAVVGGTSAGLAVLGEFLFAAYEDTVTSDEALANPFDTRVQLDREFLEIPLLARVITDSHFAARDRMGRLIAFMARIIQDGWSDSVIGLGVDERTALVVGPDGSGEVLGTGSVYVVRSNGLPESCEPGHSLEYAGLTLSQVGAGQTIQLPACTTSVSSTQISATGGDTVPADPY